MPVSLPSDCPPADLQSLIGGPAVVALAAEHGIAAATPGAAIGVAVASAHPQAGRFLDAVAARIAFGLAAVAGVLDPPLIVLAGDVAQAGGEVLRSGSVPRCPARPRLTSPSPSPRSPTTPYCSARSKPDGERCANP